MPISRQETGTTILMSIEKAAAPVGTAASKPAKAHPQSTANRRNASRRAPALDCGCADPIRCRCANDEPSDRYVDAYAAALRHLKAAGLAGAPLVPEMRAMWRRGGDARRMVEDVAGGWVMTQ